MFVDLPFSSDSTKLLISQCHSFEGKRMLHERDSTGTCASLARGSVS